MIDIVEEIDKILKSHKTNYYKFDKSLMILIKINPKDIGVDFNVIVAELTGLLIINNIAYTMSRDHNITILI